jgi:dynamin family protein
MAHRSQTLPSSNHILAEVRASVAAARDQLAVLESARRGSNDAAFANGIGNGTAEIDRIVSRSLGVVGEEGAGKSTLVNAIFGLSLVPTDSNQPGTAAPIVIRADSRASLSWSISSVGESGLHACTGQEEFASYLLQATNADNVKRVLRGQIAVPSRHLADGLSIVDLPGFEGMSDEIRKEAINALQMVDGALVVVADRAVGPAMRTIGQLLGVNGEVDAVVINLRSSKLVNSQLLPLSDAQVSEHIDGIKAFIHAAFAKAGFALKSEQLFAIHLPSMHELSLSAGSKLGASAHVEEINRFEQWFSLGYGHRGAATRLTLALDEMDNLRKVVDEAVRADNELITGLRQGEPRAQAVVARRIAEFRGELPRRWRQAAQAGLAAMDKRTWDNVEAAVTKLKQTLVRMTADAQSKVPKSWWDTTMAIRDRIASDLNEGAREAAEALHSAVAQALSGYLDACAAAARELLRAEAGLLPIEMPAVDRVRLSIAPLWLAPSFDSQDQTFGAFLDSRETMRRLIREAALAELLVDGRAGGPLHERLLSELGKARDAQLGVLLKRLDVLERLVSGGDAPVLSAAAGVIESQAAAIVEIRQKIENGRSMLQQLDELEHERIAQARAHQAILQQQRAEYLRQQKRRQSDNQTKSRLPSGAAEPVLPALKEQPAPQRLPLWRRIGRLLGFRP